jgi:AcrR family transcriptional regulator
MVDSGNQTPDALLVPTPLRAGLVDAALAMLIEEGLPAVTLRGVARRAGVSHAAPLKHYSSFADLLAETGATGFEALSRNVDEAGASLPAGVGGAARLVGASRAYVQTATDNPPLFALMFRFDLLDTTNERYRRASTDAYREFLRFVRAAQDEGWHADVPTEVVNATIWSMVHGMAMLWSDGALAASLNGIVSLDELIDRALEMVMGSLKQAERGERARVLPAAALNLGRQQRDVRWARSGSRHGRRLAELAQGPFRRRLMLPGAPSSTLQAADPPGNRCRCRAMSPYSGAATVRMGGSRSIRPTMVQKPPISMRARATPRSPRWGRPSASIQ